MYEAAYRIASLFLLGLPGWFVLGRLRAPAAALLGSMISVGLFRAFGFGPAAVSDLVKPLLQILVGLFIGLRVNDEVKRTIKSIAAPALLVSSWWLAVSFAAGYILYGVTPIDMKTAFLGSTPGGVAEMSLLAVSLGGDPASVALLQFFRLASVLTIVPLAGPWLCRAFFKEENLRGVPASAAAGTRPGDSSLRIAGVSSYAEILMFAFAGGGALYWTGFPAGGLVGSALAVGGARLCGRCRGGIPYKVRSWAQAGLGAVIGLNVTKGTLVTLASMSVPVCILTALMLASGFTLAILLRRLTGWSLQTCLLATCAAGMTQMSVVAEDMGGDPVTVTLLYLVRLVTIVAVLPPVFAFFLR